MGAVRHHGREDGGGRPPGQTAGQARPLTQQPASLSQPTGERKQPEMTDVLISVSMCTCDSGRVKIQ